MLRFCLSRPLIFQTLALLTKSKLAVTAVLFLLQMELPLELKFGPKGEAKRLTPSFVKC